MTTTHFPEAPSRTRLELVRKTLFACLTSVALLACFGKERENPALTGGSASTPPAAIDRVSTRSAPPSGTNALDSYPLDNPTRVDTLPRTLDEASGLTDVSNTEVAIVQDELGVIFVYDLKARAVTRQVPFGAPGDYEGLTRLGETMFVLASDGTLITVNDWRGTARVERVRLDLPTSDNEGLGYDPFGDRLLVAPKSRWQPGKTNKHLRAIFALDPKSRKLDVEPALVIDVNLLIDYANAHDQDLPTKVKAKTKKGKSKVALRFMPASIAVHPKTRDLYVISAVDRVLAAFDRAGNVTGYAMLDAERYRQPEGMTFLADGTLVIANEGAGEDPQLIQLRPNPAAASAGSP